MRNEWFLMIHQAVFCCFASKYTHNSSNVGLFLVKLELMNLYTLLNVIDSDGKPRFLFAGKSVVNKKKRKMYGF